MKPRCIAFDFDLTLSYFKDDKEGLYALFERQGISKERVCEAHANVRRKSVFSIENVLSELEQMESRTFLRAGEKTIARACEAWMRDSLTLYPECREVLSMLEKTIPIAIVTFGNKEFQTKKVMMSGIPYHTLHVTAVQKGKPAELRKLLKQYGKPILYVDDRASDLDSVREQELRDDEIITVLLRRNDDEHNLYHTEIAAHTHTIIKNLREVLPLLK